MDLQTLLGLLDIGGPEEFEYFENFADLIEMDGEIPQETIYELMRKIPMKKMGSLAQQYFEDILEHFPEDEIELFTLIESIKIALVGAAKRAKEERDIAALAGELHRFRNWFRFESNAYRKDRRGNLMEELSVFDAITAYRSDQLGNSGDGEYSYNFENCLNYALDEYVVPFSGEPEGPFDYDDDEDGYEEYDVRDYD